MSTLLGNQESERIREEEWSNFFAMNNTDEGNAIFE